METSADPSPATSNGAAGPAVPRLGSPDVSARCWPKATAWRRAGAPDLRSSIVRGPRPTAALTGARGSDSDFFVLYSL